MRSRSHVLEKFSTFIHFEGDSFARWITNSRLLLSLERCGISPETLETVWVRYWHETWKRQSIGLASQHLLAYLQEPCYYATQGTLNRYGQYLSVRYRLSDCFQETILYTGTVLDSFDPTLASLSTFAQEVFRRKLTDRLRECNEIDTSTDWSLLRRVRNRRLVNALKSIGLSEIEVEQYRLARNCFVTLYSPTIPTGLRQLPEPEWETWVAIAQLYNQERTRQLQVAGLACSPDRIRRWMTNCAAAIRAYRFQPPMQSLDAPRVGQESGNLGDELPATLDESLLSRIVMEEEALERQQLQFRLHQVLMSTLKELDQQTQTILHLYYRKRVSQSQISQQLNIAQPTVCRRLAKAEERLLQALVQWSQADLNKSVTPDLIKSMRTALKTWLEVRYRASELPSISSAAELEE